MKTLCIYHANCMDGFTAAYVVHKAIVGTVDLHAAQYGDELPKDLHCYDHVVVVDFSYPHDQMEQLINETAVPAKVTVLDHHKTAEAELAPLIEKYQDDELVHIEFDMNRSGAGMARDHFIGGPRSNLIDYVEDRDLWRFKKYKCKEVCAYLFNHEYSLDTWHALEQWLNQRNGLETAIEIGSHLMRKHTKDVERMIDIGMTTETIGGVEVPCANMPPMFASEAGHIMAQNAPFAATYYISKDGEKWYSLRSAEDGMDVSKIAKMYDGGGHKHSAGFKVKA